MVITPQQPSLVQCLSLMTLTATLALCGCGNDPPPAPASGGATVAPSVTSTSTGSVPAPGMEGTTTNAPVSSGPPATSPAPLALPKISLSGSPSGAGTDTSGSSATKTGSAAVGSKTGGKEAVLAALHPLQILRDNWQVIQQKEAGTSDALQHQEWIWDFKSDRNRPAIVMASPEGKYISSARVTFDPATDKYLMELVTPEGEARSLEGEFSEPVQDLQGGDNKPQRTYKLLFTQVAPADSKEQWQVLLNQRENNRYLMELSKKRGGANFLRFDTLGAQRMGTSFALSDTDYGDRTCVVSGGLGTAAVTFEGKTFYVCCSGCRAAFDEEPKTWIADYEAKMKK